MSLYLLVAVSSASATQIAQYFIHGKGNHGLASRGNVWAYWDNGNFLAVGHGCGVPYDYSTVDGTFRIEEAAPGALVFRQFDVGDKFYVIARGRVRVSATTDDGIEHTLRPGGTFTTFQYLHGYGLRPGRVFRREMNVRMRGLPAQHLVLKNFPIAFILTWTRPAQR